MKNIILSLLTVFAFVTVNAQEKQAPKGKAQASPEQRVERRINKLMRFPEDYQKRKKQE